MIRRVFLMVLLIVLMVTGLMVTGKERVDMGLGWETYGQRLGYTQEQWDALPQVQKDAIKEGLSYSGSGPLSPVASTYYNQMLADRRAGYTPQPAVAPTNPIIPTSGGVPLDQTLDTSGGGGGGGMSLTAPLLNESPEWLAYLNALNLEEQQYRADVDRTRGVYQSDATRMKQDTEPVYGQQRRGIAGSLENRGMARSGELLRRLAENRAAQGRQIAGIDATLAGQTAGLESQLAQKLLGLGTQRADRELQMRAQGYV